MLEETEPYEYSRNGGISWFTSEVISDLPAGSYTIGVRDANGCMANRNIVITEPQERLACSLTKQDLTCFENNTGEITVTGMGGTPTLSTPTGYEYSLDGTTWQPGNVFVGLEKANHEVIIRDGNGCISQCVILVEEPDPLVCDLTGADLTDCDANDGMITATITGGTATLVYSDRI